jgi:cytochrome b561
MRTDSYDRVAIAFHWVIAVLVIVNLSIGILHESLLEGLGVMPVHKAIGITVLVLSIGRLAWRLTHRTPPLPEGMSAWERWAAKATHWGFYVLLIILPLSGWAMSSSPQRPRPVDFFGLFDVPVLPVSEAVAGLGHEAHELLGWLMLALVLLHVAAALRHHFILRDATLVRMLGKSAPRG